jgi:hypothetical protein
MSPQYVEWSCPACDHRNCNNGERCGSCDEPYCGGDDVLVVSVGELKQWLVEYPDQMVGDLIAAYLDARIAERLASVGGGETPR